MAVTQADIKFYKSSDTDSTGGDISATEITDDTLNNLFDDVSGDESLSGLVDYRKIFIKNENASADLESTKLWIESLTSSEDDEIDISTTTNLTGSDPTGDGQSYVRPTSKTHADVLDLSTISAGGDYSAVWIRRTVSAGASAYTNDSAQLKVEGETVA